MFYSGMKFMFFDFETTGITTTGDIEIDSLPISVVMLMTDEYLIIEDICEVPLIKWPSFAKQTDWTKEQHKAFQVHKIPFDDIIDYGVSPANAINKIISFVPNNLKMKPTLVSDNAYFDTLMLNHLFNFEDKRITDYFHYTTWDINMLYKAAGVEKVIEHKHTAMSDVCNMYHRTLRALEKIRYFG